MEVRHRQQISRVRLQPPRGGRGLAGRTVAVAAGIVGDLLVPALEALQDMTAQCRSATGGQVLEGAALLDVSLGPYFSINSSRQLRMTSATVGRGRVMTGDLLAASGQGDRAGC